MLLDGHLLKLLLLLPVHLVKGFSFDDYHALALRLILLIKFQSAGKRGAKGLLIALCQFPADGDIPLP